MNSIIYLFCIQLTVFQTVYSQCPNRIVQGPNGPIELLPNQVLVPPGVPYFGPLPPGAPIPAQGRPVLIPGPPSKNPGQSVIVPGPPAFPAEYTNIPNAVVNYGPYVSAPPNVLPGNPIAPNVVLGIPNVASGLPNLVSGNRVVTNAASAVLPVETYPPTVVHDSSVANSLANALQLLVVSNLISSTLPGPYEPPCYDPYGMPPYNYIY